MSKLNSIESLMDGYNPQRQLLEQTRQLVTKWEPTGLLEGMEDETQRHGMAVLLENQAGQLIQEASVTGGQNAEEWSGVALPLVRRIFGELAAQDFVSVQPMNLPSGLIFYLDFKYGSAQTGNHTENADVYGNTSGSNTDATGGLYGAGKFGYSINDKDSGTLTIGTTQSGSAGAAGVFATGSVSWQDVEFEPDLSASQAIAVTADNALLKVVTATTSYENVDTDGVRAFSISGSGFDEFFPAFTKHSATDSTITFIVRKSGTGAPINAVVKYHAQPSTNYSRTDFEATAAQVDANPETDIDIPELDIALKSIPIIAKTRKLKAVWTPELAQDLNAYHSVDAEAELTSLLSEYISMEIDLEILDMLKAGASAKTENWSARVGFEFNSATNLFEEQSGASNAYTKGEWFQTLGNKIQAVSNAIHQKTLRGGANFLVVSPETATILESIPGYATGADGDANTNQFAMGVQKVGAINNRYTVYKNPYMLENDILVGFRGANFLETGAVYAPYVPLIMTPLVYDPKNFTPRKGVMTRYAKKMIRPEFYGKVIVADVNFV
tara:strand:+ start:159 stop:1823 length:1665 start_codon:yes stop_codon:yes gene_type:complete